MITQSQRDVDSHNSLSQQEIKVMVNAKWQTCKSERFIHIGNQCGENM